MSDLDIPAEIELIESIEKNEYVNLNNGEKWKKGREDFDYVPEFSLNGLLKFWTSICRVEIGPAAQTTAADYPAWGRLGAPWASLLDNTFRISDRGSSFWIECIGRISIIVSH
jgi:hypothetical protein